MGSNYVYEDGVQDDIAALIAQTTGIGYAHEAVDISATDHTVTMTKSRVITCVPAAITSTIKVDMTVGTGTAATTATVTLPACGGFIFARNVTKVYKSGTDATDINIWK